MKNTQKMICLLTLISTTAGCLATWKPELVEKVDIVLDQGSDRLCADQLLIPLEAKVTYTDGQQFTTWIETLESRGGKLSFRKLQWKSNLGTIDKRGFLRLPDNPLAWLDKELILQVSLDKRPEMKVIKRFTPDYGCRQVIDYSGRSGGKGVSAAYDKDGLDGQDGPHLLLSLAYLNSGNDRKRILVRIKSYQTTKYYVFDTQGATPVVLANGGDGQDGANGASGEDVRKGYSHNHAAYSERSESGHRAAGGSGQNGGDGGDGGRGGRIDVFFDQAHPELAGFIQFETKGGAAGQAGDGGIGGSGGFGGSHGSRGSDGNPGTNGLAGLVKLHSDDVTKLYAAEIEQGVPIADSEKHRAKRVQAFTNDY